MADTELQQLIVWVGTTEKIEQARAQGLITENDFAITTDAPEFQTKLTSANAGTGISITEVGGVVKISNTQTSAEWGNILGNLPDQSDLWSYLSDILGDIADIKSLIPAQASSSNQLADKEFVNSSIATNTANFIGTFESISDLESYSGDVTNNDYAFVINGVVTDGGNDWATFNDLNAYDKTLLTNFDYAWVINGSNFDLYRFDIVNQVWELRAEDIEKDSVSLNTAYNRYKATVSGSTLSWEYEYTLNNSSFTAAQWEAINSGATEAKINQITTNQNAIGTLANLTTTEKNNLVGAVNELDSTKQDNINDLQQIREGAAAGASAVQPSQLGTAAYENTTSFATAAQGTKADSAIQGVNVDSTSLTPDANKVVNIPVAYQTTKGVVLVSDAGYGIKSMSTGQLQIHSGDWSKFSSALTNPNQWLPIVTKDLLLGMKVFLGTTITSSTSNVSWNDTEKASARNTLDIPDKTIFRDYDE